MRREGIMTCAEAKELIAAVWIASPWEPGGLDPDAAAELRRHLVSCEECGSELPGLSDLWGRLAEIPAPEPSQALHRRWQSTLDAMVRKETVSKRKRWPGSLADLWPRNPVW